MRSVATFTDLHVALSETGVASVAFAHDGYTPGPVPAKRRSLTEVTLSPWTRTLHSCREPWRPTAVIKRCKQTHVLQRKAAALGRSLTELVLPVRIQFSGGQRQELSGSMLIDLGSEVLALAPESFFWGCTLELARRPLRITVVNGERISGGTREAVDLSVQIRDCQDQPVQVVCEKVFVYKADVQEHLIVGYPFCKAYGLMVDPTRDLLVDALCGPENRTNERCSVASGQCACRAVPVKQKKVSKVKSYVARLIGLASDSDEEPAVPRAPYVSGAAVVSVAAVHTARVLPVVAAVAAASCSAALLCFGSGPMEKQAGLSTCPDRPQEKCEHNSRCTECVHECMCARGKHQGLPDPELVRRRHYTEDEASDQGLTDEESDSELPPSITQPLEAAPPPDTFAGSWGNFKPYSGPWSAQDQGLDWLQQPDAAFLDHSQSLLHFCACEVEELCDHCCPRPCEAPESQQKQDPLQGRAQASTSLLSASCVPVFPNSATSSTFQRCSGVLSCAKGLGNRLHI